MKYSFKIQSHSLLVFIVKFSITPQEDSVIQEHPEHQQCCQWHGTVPSEDHFNLRHEIVHWSLEIRHGHMVSSQDCFLIRDWSFEPTLSSHWFELTLCPTLLMTSGYQVCSFTWHDLFYWYRISSLNIKLLPPIQKSKDSWLNHYDFKLFGCTG